MCFSLGVVYALLAVGMLLGSHEERGEEIGYNGQWAFGSHIGVVGI